MKTVWLLPLLSCFVCTLAAHTEDREYWQRAQWTHYQGDDWKSYFTSEARFNQDWSRFYFIRLTENLSYQPCKNLECGVHVSYIHRKPESQRYFTNTYRLELEANPQFSWHRADVVLRNRLELIKDERVPIIQKVYRARASIFYPLEGFGSLIGIGASEEVFYHFNQSRFTQSRFIPLELTFAECQDHSISAFFMVRNFLSGTEWTTSWIFGTSLNF
jgi:hypothetical protein